MILFMSILAIIELAAAVVIILSVISAERRTGDDYDTHD